MFRERRPYPAYSGVGWPRLDDEDEGIALPDESPSGERLRWRDLTWGDRIGQAIGITLECLVWPFLEPLAWLFWAGFAVFYLPYWLWRAWRRRRLRRETLANC